MVVHGSFRLDVDVEAPLAQVYAAVEQPHLRGRWLRLPGRPEPSGPAADGGEVLRSSLMIGDAVERLERRTHVAELRPEERVVLTYTAVVNDRIRWVSLVTVEFLAQAPGTHLTWTEQYAFLEMTGDGRDDVAHLRGGTALQLNGLAVSLGAVPRAASRS